MAEPTWHERRMDARRAGQDPRAIKKQLGDTKLWPYVVIVLGVVLTFAVLGQIFS